MDRIDLDYLIATWAEPVGPDTIEDLAALNALLELFGERAKEDSRREAAILVGWETVHGR